MSKFEGIDQDRQELHSQRLEGEISRRELLKMASPLGKVTIDGLKCTGCGLCASDCPTQALVVSASDGTDTFQLLFRHSLCIACGQCLELCPEQCLYLERTLELDMLNNPPVVLFDDEIVRCRECGNAIGSRTMIERVKVKLPDGGNSINSHFTLCPECKVKQFSLTGQR